MVIMNWVINSLRGKKEKWIKKNGRPRDADMIAGLILRWRRYAGVGRSTIQKRGLVVTNTKALTPTQATRDGAETVKRGRWGLLTKVVPKTGSTETRGAGAGAGRVWVRKRDIRNTLEIIQTVVSSLVNCFFTFYLFPYLYRSKVIRVQSYQIPYVMDFTTISYPILVTHCYLVTFFAVHSYLPNNFRLCWVVYWLGS